MSHRTRSRSFDYAAIAKKGFLLGVALFALGSVGEVVGHAYLGSMPTSVERLFLGLEVTGVLLGLLVPIVFGAVLPLIE